MDFVSNLFEESIALPQMSLKNCPNLYPLFEKDNIDHTDVLNNVSVHGSYSDHRVQKFCPQMFFPMFAHSF